MLDGLAGLDPGDDGSSFGKSVCGNQDIDRHTNDLLAGVAEHPLGGRVPARDDTVQGPADNGIIGALNDRRDALGGPECLPLLGHVPDDRIHSDDGAVSAMDRRDGENDRKRRSVLSETYALKIHDTVAGPDLCQDLADFAGSILGSQVLTGLADHLLAGEAEQPFGGRVPARDDALKRGADDGFPAELDHGRHTLSDLERPSLLGHVSMHLGCANDLIILVADRRDGEGDGHFRSVLADAHGLQTLDRFAILDAVQVGEELFLSALRGQAGAELANDLLA